LNSSRGCSASNALFFNLPCEAVSPLSRKGNTVSTFLLREIALDRWLAITLISSLIGGSRPRSFWTSFAGEKGSQELSPWIVFGTLPRTLGFRSPHRSLASTERPTVHLIDHTLGWRSP
jgi:hypothetical protein